MTSADVVIICPDLWTENEPVANPAFRLTSHHGRHCPTGRSTCLSFLGIFPPSGGSHSIHFPISKSWWSSNCKFPARCHHFKNSPKKWLKIYIYISKNKSKSDTSQASKKTEPVANKMDFFMEEFHSLKLSCSSLKIGLLPQKGTAAYSNVFQPSIFRCESCLFQGPGYESGSLQEFQSSYPLEWSQIDKDINSAPVLLQHDGSSVHTAKLRLPKNALPTRHLLEPMRNAEMLKCCCHGCEVDKKNKTCWGRTHLQKTCVSAKFDMKFLRLYIIIDLKLYPGPWN